MVTFWISSNGHADSLGVKKQVGQKWPFPVVKGLKKKKSNRDSNPWTQALKISSNLIFFLFLEDEENDDDDEENPRNVALQLLDTIAIKLPNTEVLPVILNFATQAAQG